MSEIKIRDAFSRYPGPRYRQDGPFSGQEFREEILEPRLRQAIAASDMLDVVLDDVSGYGSSFLEETFGGLVRAGFTSSQIERHLNIIARTTRFEHHRIRAQTYIKDAVRKKERLTA